MALIKTGGIVTQLSGKIGGQSFGTGRSGPYLKNIGSYKKNLSNKQNQRLAVFSYLSQAWRLLDSGQRLAWNEAAPNFPYINRVGDEKIYSGFNLFVKFNGSLYVFDDPILTEPPSPASFSNPVNLLIESTAGSWQITAGGVDNNSLYFLHMTMGVSPGRTSSGMNFRLINIYTPAELEASGNVIPQYSEVYGAPIPGAQYHWYIKAVKDDSGQSIKKYGSGSIIFIPSE